MSRNAARKHKTSAGPLTLAIWRLDSEGLSPNQIAIALGCGVDRVAISLRQVTPENQAAILAPPPKERPCLTCKRPFASTWSGHRICDGCKATSAWTLPAQMIGGPAR